MLKPDDNPACKDHDYLPPDAWYPEPAERKSKSYELSREMIIKMSVEALKACNSCPIRQACLDYSFTSAETIDYGIFGGTLSRERRIATGSEPKRAHGRDFDLSIRTAADKAGVPRHSTGKRERALSWIANQPELIPYFMDLGRKHAAEARLQQD